MSAHDTSLLPPDWAFEFHGHQCPFMPLGYRMGLLATQCLGIDREQDHTMHVVCELGEGHPQTCLMDGIQVATGATFGKTLIEKTFWGRLAATFWYPGKTAVRYWLKPSFLDAFGTQEFFAYRKKGIEPSGIPADVTRKAIDWMLSQADDDVFAVTEKPDFQFTPPKGSFNKSLCSVCGEYVFERYVRLQDGKPVYIPCSGYARSAAEGPGMISTLLVSFAVVLVISGVFSMFGKGGGSLYTPVLVMLGFELGTAISTALFLNLVTAAVATWVFARNRLVDWRFSRVFLPKTIAGSLLGAMLSARAPRDLLLGIFAAFLVSPGS